MTEATPQPNHFDRGKPFYPITMGYVAQLIGFKELALRGIFGDRCPSELVAKITERQQPTRSIEELSRMVEKAAGPLELRATVPPNPVKVDIDAIAQELLENLEHLTPYYLAAASAALVLAHEVSKNESWHNQDPLWEFLRHCRNAAGHGGLFNFLNGEPRRPAQWAHLSITSAMNGTPLFKPPDGRGLLEVGDPIRLLWDIEQAYPAMTA